MERRREQDPRKPELERPQHVVEPRLLQSRHIIYERVCLSRTTYAEESETSPWQELLPLRLQNINENGKVLQRLAPHTVGM